MVRNTNEEINKYNDREEKINRNITDSYDKTDIDNKLNLKLNLSEINTYYIKLEINDKIILKWNQVDPNSHHSFKKHGRKCSPVKPKPTNL